MSLTSEQVNEILIDETTGRKPTIQGAEADALRKDLAKDIDLAKSKGWQVEVPAEWSVEGVSEKGGAGSGNYGHSGRQGEVGGSSVGDATIENAMGASVGRHERLNITNGSSEIRRILSRYPYERSGTSAGMKVEENRTKFPVPEERLTERIKGREHIIVMSQAEALATGQPSEYRTLTDGTKEALSNYPTHIQALILGNIDEIRESNKLQDGATYKQKYSSKDDSVTRSVIISSGNSAQPRLAQAELTHEFAHALDYSFNKKIGQSLSDTKEYTHAMLKGGLSVSQYANKDEKEHFAEHATAYVYAPEHLKEINPQVHGFFTELFAGKRDYQNLNAIKMVSNKGEDSNVFEIVETFEGSVVHLLAKDIDREVVKMIIENGLSISGIDTFEVAEKRLREEGVQFDKSIIAEKVFCSGDLACAVWVEQNKELIISPKAVIGKGGAGSGNFGHSGREGERGGSAPADGGSGGGDTMADVQRSIAGQYREVRDEIDKVRDERGSSQEHYRDAGMRNPQFPVDYNIKVGKVEIPDFVREGGMVEGEHIEAIGENVIEEIFQQEAQDRIAMFADNAKAEYKDINEIGQAGRGGGWLVVDYKLDEDGLVDNHNAVQGKLGEVKPSDISDWKKSYQDTMTTLTHVDQVGEDIKGMVRNYKSDLSSPKWWKERMMEKHEKGGAGSGNYGHSGRAGEVGGSASEGGASWESRVQAEEANGATRSDAQAIVDAQDAKAGRERDSGRAKESESQSGGIKLAVDGKADVPKDKFDRLWDKYHSKDYFSLQNTPEREAMGIHVSEEQVAGLKEKTYAFMRQRMTEMSEGKMPPQREKLSWELYREMTGTKIYISKGGQGSGNFGHAGREGERGGSAPSDATAGADAGASAGESQATNGAGTTMEAGAKELGKDVLGSFKQDGGEFGEDMSDRVGSIEVNGEGMNIIASEDDAIAIAEEQVRNDLENEPELFNQEWLQNYVSMSETDIRIIADEEATSLTDDLDDKEVIDRSGKQDEFDNLQEKMDAMDDPTTGEYKELEDAQAKLVESGREDLQSQKYDEVKSALEKDPKDYFVNELGAYTAEDLMKQPFIRIDIDNATEDAVAEDGWAHFISRYDGDFKSTDNGAVYFRRSDKREKVLLRAMKIGKSRNMILGMAQKRIVKNKAQGETSNNEMIICKTDEAKRMVYGIFLYPEEADHDGDVISAEDIEKVAHGFMTDYRTIDEMHKEVIEADIVESAIAWKDDLEVFGKKVKKGTWFGAVKVNDDKVWDKVKAGLYKGFSVRISGVREDYVEKGGAGSGNFGHSGRAGEVGGSASGENVVENPISDKPADGKPAKNPYGKTVKVNEPHAVFRENGWEWRVLKTYQTPEKEKENPYARWFCAVKSPMTQGGYDMGDTYIKDVGKSEVVKPFGEEAKEPLEKW